MRKFLLTAFLGMSALIVSAQQWNGSTTATDTIYRDGMVRMIGATGAPFSEWTPSEFKMYQYNSTWRDDYIRISYEGIQLKEHIPAPSNTTTIGHGTFSFNTGSATDGGYHLNYNYQGVLSNNGKIITSDSLIGNNIKATNSINAYSVSATTSISGSSGTFSNKVTAPTIAVNNTSVPTNFKFGVTGKSYFSDFVGIGTTNLTATSGYKLAVDGGILCEEVKVIANVPSADYVFEKDYNLRTLNEVEAFVNENKHLPDVPSAKEFKENGYKMGDMDNLLLQKIEELTLYIIEQQKQIDDLKNKLNE